MACKVGYPDKPCPFGFDGIVTRKSCGPCKHFEPPRHILQWCRLWDRDRVLCLKPKSACEKCPEKAERTLGKLPGEGRDLDDPAVRRVYEAEYRAKNPEKVAEKLERFKSKNPTYWRDYMRARRAAARGCSEPGSDKI